MRLTKEELRAVIEDWQNNFPEGGETDQEHFYRLLCAAEDGKGRKAIRKSLAPFTVEAKEPTHV